MEIINIMLADDHNVLRQGIAQALDSQKDMHVVAQASNGEETLRLAGLHKPDVILMDIKMPGLDGVEATKIITEKYKNIKIIILTMYRRDEYIFEAIKAGASGYLLKEVEMDELLSAVRRVHQGHAVLDSSVANRVFAELRSGGVPDPQSKIELADRDVEILHFLSQGLSNQEIADKLFLSEKTVRNRLSNVFRQYGLKNRTEAALFALRIGIKENEDIDP